MYLKVHTCSIVLLVTFIVGAAGDYCFRNRVPSGPFGQCDDRIRNKDTAAECCRAGGAGWTIKRNGKRCGPACLGGQNPVPATTQQPTTTQPPAEVDGGWSDYGEWSECSQTCEEGIQTRTRTCTNPRPQYGGRECEGIDTETQICRKRRFCPVHGGWSDWGRWSRCDSPRCGVDGTRLRSRECNNPKPKYWGRYCVGQIIDRETCSKRAVPGGWSEWSQWGPCSENCRPGDIRIRYRICNNPLPQNGGFCEGNFKQTGECHGLNPCPNGQGSGSGDGSGSPLDADIFPCDDEDTCNYGAGNDEPEDSFSYSLGGLTEVPKDVTPQAYKPRLVYYLYPFYSLSFYYYEYNNGDSDSYSFDQGEDNAGSGGAPQNAPQVEENNGDSDSYSYDGSEYNADPAEDNAQECS